MAPSVVLVEEHGTDGADAGGVVGEVPTTSERRLTSLLIRSPGFVDAIFGSCAAAVTLVASTNQTRCASSDQTSRKATSSMTTIDVPAAAPLTGHMPAGMRSRPTRAVTPQHVRNITLAAAGAGLIGSVAPWIIASGFINLNVGGMDGDGKITLAVAIVAALIALAPAFPKRLGLRIAASTIGAATAGVALNVLRQIYSSGSQSDQAGVFLSAGWGLWITLAAGIAMTVVPWAAAIAARAPHTRQA
jgi:hypothetical protein